jgi:peptide/nickel transport system substrate-binding protein
MKKVTWSLLAILLVFGIWLCSCRSYKRNSTEVVLWELNDPDMLNPLNSTDANTSDILANLYQPLINYDFKTLKMVPVLADSLPKIETDSSGKVRITYEIRKEAKWDNGTPITAKDVDFTFKAIKNPSVNDEALRSYFDFVNDIEYIKTYPVNPWKFTIVCDRKYVKALSISGETIILPEYAYDPNKYMEHFTLKQMHDDKNTANDPNMIAFAKDFNSDKYSRDPKYVSGSGAYRFVSWTTGQRVVLEKKKDWWGNSLAGANSYFDAYPDKLIFQTVNDLTSALVSLKAGNIDVMHQIKPQDFIDLPKSEKFTSNFNMYSPLNTFYDYIGLNTANPKLSDVRTRQALAHLCDVQKMIKDVMYGYAEQTIGHISPMDSANYNYNIKPYENNIDTAKALLAEAGWKDSDGDGILDKMIDGKKTDFTLDFLVNAGNDKRKKVALIFQEAARKLGITVNVIQQDWSVYIGNIKKHNFEMYCGGWVPPYGPEDYRQIFYTTSALNGGSNWVSFGNAASDALIDSIRVEMNDKIRAGMVKRLQVIMHYQSAYIFLWNEKMLMAISKKFSNAYPSFFYPGYWEAGFKASAE